MTKHYELADSIPGNIYQRKFFAALRFISVCNCVFLWQIQLNSVHGVGGGYVKGTTLRQQFPQVESEDEAVKLLILLWSLSSCSTK
jgi:hypothetical protein